MRKKINAEKIKLNQIFLIEKKKRIFYDYKNKIFLIFFHIVGGINTYSMLQILISIYEHFNYKFTW